MVLALRLQKLDRNSKISFLRSSSVQDLSLDILGNVGKCHLHTLAEYQSQNFGTLIWFGSTVLALRLQKFDRKSKISILRSSYVQYLWLDTLTNHVRCHPHPCIGKPVSTPSSTVQYICCHGICCMGLKSCPNRKISFLRPSCVQKLSFDTAGKVDKWHLHAKPIEQSWNSTCYVGMGSTV